MKVPYAPSVGVPSGAAGYQRAPDFSALEQGVVGGLRDVARAGYRLQSEQNQIAEYKAHSDFFDMEQRVGDQIEELKRNAAPGANIMPEANKIVDKEKATFLASVPPSLQAQFNTRVEGLRFSQHNDLRDFQYRQNDAYSKLDIQKKYDTATEGVTNDPSTVDAWDGRINELIDSSTLSELDKTKLKQETHVGLYAAYSLKEKINLAFGSQGMVEYESRTKQIESGQGDVTGAHWGPYQFSDETGLQYGITRKSSLEDQRRAFFEFTADNQRYLQRKLGREPTQGELYLAHQQGEKGAVALLTHPDASAASIVGSRAVAQNAGQPDMTAAQFTKMWTSKFEGIGATDPRFAEVPFAARAEIDKQVANEVKNRLEQIIPDQLTSLAANGTFTGVDPPKTAFQAAYGDEGDKRYQQYQDSKQTALATYDYQRMPNDAIAADLEKARRAIPTGEGAAAAQKDYQIKAEAASKIIVARSSPADYVMGAFPDVRGAWEAYDPNNPESAKAAISYTFSRQKELGLPLQPMPKEMADRAVAQFKSEALSSDQRAFAVAGLVLATPDKVQQQAIFQQLVDSGLDPALESGVEAAARGDGEAAKRLFYAAMTPEEKFPLPGTTQEVNTLRTSITDAVSAKMKDVGSPGELYYGTEYGDPQSFVRQQRAVGLAEKAARVLVVQKHMQPSDAADQAMKDIMGNVTRVNVPLSQGKLDVILAADLASSTQAQTGFMRLSIGTTAPLVEGAERMLPIVQNALEAQSTSRITASGLSGEPLRQLIYQEQQKAADALSGGIFRNLSHDSRELGFFDPLSGFVKKPDGTPLTFTIPELLQSSVARTPGL